MSLICRKCRRLIRDEFINYNLGTCFCKKCNRTYRVSEQQQNGRRKGLLYRPMHSEIIVDKSEDEFSIKIPTAGFGLFPIVLIFLFGGLCFLEFFLISAIQEFGLSYIVLVGIFILLNVFVFFVYTFGQIVLLIDKDKLHLKRQLFSLSFTKTRSTKSLIFVYETIVLSVEGQHLYMIELEFKDQKNLKFASHLSDNERKWIIEEIKSMKRELFNI